MEQHGNNSNGNDSHSENDPLLAITRQPLGSSLLSENTTIEVAKPSDEPAAKSFDRVQILFLCYSGIAEPIAFFSLFSYINEMIFRTGQVPATSVGFYSGLIESLFSIAQMLVAIMYGKMADRIGRKPVLVFSQVGVSISLALFGMSVSIWQMVLFRCLGELFAGSVVTIRTMLSESCDKKGQAKAFSWYMVAKNLGLFIGPLIGCTLARPADYWPGLPTFFSTYPYALAGFAASGICFSAAFVSQFVLKETLVHATTKDKPEKLSTWEILKSPGLSLVLVIFAQVYLQGLAFTALSPVTWFTPINAGGFSFSERYIAAALSICGICQSLFMLFAFPFLQSKYGNKFVFKIAAYLDVLLFISYPVFNQFRRHGWELVFWIAAPLTWGLCTGGAMAFTSAQLSINNASPSNHVLATVNALAVTLGSGIRAFTPAAFGSLYAVGVKNQILAGNLAWAVLTAIGVGLPVLLRYLPERSQSEEEE